MFGTRVLRGLGCGVDGGAGLLNAGCVVVTAFGQYGIARLQRLQQRVALGEEHSLAGPDFSTSLAVTIIVFVAAFVLLVSDLFVVLRGLCLRHRASSSLPR